MINSKFLTPNLKPLTTTLKTIIKSKKQNIIKSKNLKKTPSKPLSTSLSTLINNKSNTYYIKLHFNQN